ncbi:uncharacterized protein Z518_00643 [Rhinocladiella mackenziei CBS 650.93]|uniref:Rhinocladiella mackenziei CBS 650.93 unplaced genomic scaffold supercont1.1, whole genome shotgun sequence n=1 Tax=Rhinocladiella mackenziei CBS 650.93 TaxID=1442369 RepID=A0A0D2HFZ6_9EURO|nr:uncharacterized protein Z518_00643 [Rhinocladiella mackenziei CBS 650.93]KIX09563.1 hypothetical protein Z518_00643 [Rhinocladiella mackenziei CBS 650.93]
MLMEMVSYLPISSPFISFAGRYIGDAFEAATGYNFFFLEAFPVPFEVVACNIILEFWTTKIPVTVVLILYTLEQQNSVALDKIILFLGLTFYTVASLVITQLVTLTASSK